jgi:SAM-dependent methyltransferase
MSGAVRAPTRFDLYERCVQSPATQARFLDALHGLGTRTLCEDFCGPASIARAFALLAGERAGAGVDRDPQALAHARLRAREQGIADSALALHREDVLETSVPADIIAALNFAVCELHERSALVRYLRRVRERLNPGGVFVADLYAGAEAFEPGETLQIIEDVSGATEYTWEQRAADPLTGRVNAMHFRLPDGTEMHDAFEYDWRLWGIPELRDALADAGFPSTEVHLRYGDALDDDGRLLVRPAEAWEETDETFVAYVVARTGR